MLFGYIYYHFLFNFYFRNYKVNVKKCTLNVVIVGLLLMLISPPRRLRRKSTVLVSLFEFINRNGLDPTVNWMHKT